MVIDGPNFAGGARRRIPNKLVLPKGLIAPYASNEAIKPLGRAGTPEVAARQWRRRFSLAKSS